MCTGPRERYKTISLTLSLIYNHFILSLNITHLISHTFNKTFGTKSMRRMKIIIWAYGIGRWIMYEKITQIF